MGCWSGARSSRIAVAMTVAERETAKTTAAAFAEVANPRKRTRKPGLPLTLRLTPEERATLEELAVGMTLSACVRGCLFAKETKRHTRRPRDRVADKQAAAEALALLGQSRIASNLNRLAHHANIGILILDEAEKAHIAEANAHLGAIRTPLMRALGKGP